MAATNDDGQNTFWLDGQPFQFMRKSNEDTGTEQFWLDGQPVEAVFVQQAIGNFFLMFE